MYSLLSVMPALVAMTSSYKWHLAGQITHPYKLKHIVYKKPVAHAWTDPFIIYFFFNLPKINWIFIKRQLIIKKQFRELTKYKET